ncbi:MAG: hypothetical protein AB4040_09805 [Synechococcus sp.]
MLAHRRNGSGLFMHSRLIPTSQLSRRRVLGGTQQTRKPTLLLMLSRELLLREAERQFLGLLFQEPPRSSYPARPAFTVAGLVNSDC